VFCLSGARFVAIGLIEADLNACFRNPAKARWSCSTWRGRRSPTRPGWSR